MPSAYKGDSWFVWVLLGGAMGSAMTLFAFNSKIFPTPTPEVIKYGDKVEVVDKYHFHEPRCTIATNRDSISYRLCDVDGVSDCRWYYSSEYELKKGCDE